MTNPLLKKLAPSPVNQIRLDHTHVLATFHQYHIDTPRQIKQGLVNSACVALEIHAQLEEEIFYPAMRATGADRAVLDKSVPEHNEMRRLIEALRAMKPADAAYDQTFMELMRDVIHHVADEETTLLPDAERLLGDKLEEVGAQMTKLRMQLAAPRAGEIALNTARAMSTGTLLMTAGAVLAGGYLVKRAFTPHAE